MEQSWKNFSKNELCWRPTRSRGIRISRDGAGQTTWWASSDDAVNQSFSVAGGEAAGLGDDLVDVLVEIERTVDAVRVAVGN